jgi:hypothetical protein
LIGSLKNAINVPESRAGERGDVPTTDGSRSKNGEPAESFEAKTTVRIKYMYTISGIFMNISHHGNRSSIAKLPKSMLV